MEETAGAAAARKRARTRRVAYVTGTSGATIPRRAGGPRSVTRLRLELGRHDRAAHLRQRRRRLHDLACRLVDPERRRPGLSLGRGQLHLPGLERPRGDLHLFGSGHLRLLERGLLLLEVEVAVRRLEALGERQAGDRDVRRVPVGEERAAEVDGDRLRLGSHRHRSGRLAAREGELDRHRALLDDALHRDERPLLDRRRVHGLAHRPLRGVGHDPGVPLLLDDARRGDLHRLGARGDRARVGGRPGREIGHRLRRADGGRVDLLREDDRLRVDRDLLQAGDDLGRPTLLDAAAEVLAEEGFGGGHAAPCC